MGHSQPLAKIFTVNMYRTLTLMLLVFTGIFSVSAQPVNVQQFQNTQQAQQLQTPLAGLQNATNAPELYRGENTDVGPQRILRLNPRPDYFNVFFDSQVSYSDNANFAEGKNIIGSAVFVNTVQAAFTPPAFKLGAGRLAPRRLSSAPATILATGNSAWGEITRVC